MSDESTEGVVYLHGDLDLKIVEARCLPNMDLLFERLRRCFTSFYFWRSKRRSKKHRKMITSDPYVRVCVGGSTLARTRIISNNQNPRWNERFRIPLAHPVSHLEFQVKDNDLFGADLIGTVSLPASSVLSGDPISAWFPIIGMYGRSPKPDCALFLEMRFLPCHDSPLFRLGIAADPHNFGVATSYFPARTGGAVTLYQDAHSPEGALPGIELEEGRVFSHGRCWEEMCHAILEAHHLVYITGWSIYHKVRLVREHTTPLPSAANFTLGDLLKYKSEEGVRVLLLVWDDKTSHSSFFINTSGLMQTHDEETRKFFRHSSVRCVLAPRYASSKLSIFKQQVVGTLFTHHQKCVIVDTPASASTRKISAFIGGLDLCDGRYDTPQHRLFSDHHTVFQNDYRNPTFPGSQRYAKSELERKPHSRIDCVVPPSSSSRRFRGQFQSNKPNRWRCLSSLHAYSVIHEGSSAIISKYMVMCCAHDQINGKKPTEYMTAGAKGPRQAWHDMHCKIEGPAAYDILTNFEQRWRKAAKWKELRRRFKRVTHWHDDSLLKIERISWILSPSPSLPADDPILWVSEENDPENWRVQIFRSVDSGSIKGFPKDVYAAEAQSLICAKKMVIDKSIQNAYIQAIRSAQHFIYIENQYFVGSSYAWPSYKDTGADNLIPMELALKITSKIRANERFAVYIVIPMWPEGVPSSVAVQEILFWQGQTMQMMYEAVAAELKSMSLENVHPQDYLNFYCLGKREQLKKETLRSTTHLIQHVEAVTTSQKFGRFMIYVHAKGMIVDDEYVILGSANINQRSMDGSRDTEIAMGAYQPYYTWGKRNAHPRGQVYGYRSSLWAEHLGLIDSRFKDPESMVCLLSINKIADENWRRYTGDHFVPMQGHLLRYPLKVDMCGKVSPLPGQETFPDVGGKVMGSRSATLPASLTS